MPASFVNRFLQTPTGETAYQLYKSASSFFFWLRFGIARRLPGSSSSPGLMFSPVKLLGRRIRLQHRRRSISDASAIQQCFTDAQYNMPLGAHGRAHQQLYDQIVASGKKPLIVDCGANIGASVAWFALRFPHAHIVAVEPAPDNCLLLRRNAAPFNVDVRQAGIAAEDGRAFLVNPTGEDMSYQVTFEPSDLEIPLLSIRTILAENSACVPFLLKVDIEGAEKFLFTGDLAPLAAFPVIILEPHDWMMPGRLISQEFFRFHVAYGRDFAMRHENVASIAIPSLNAEAP